MRRAEVDNQMELKVARQIAKLTQEQLAERAGVSAALICRLEQPGRKRRPSYEAIVRIATALNLEPQQLYPVAPVKGAPVKSAAA